MAMTFDQFIQLYGIDKKSRYTYAQVALMLGLSKETVRNWCRYGRRTDRGRVTLEKYDVGDRSIVVGESLIEFLRATQRDN
jgi:transposase